VHQAARPSGVNSGAGNTEASRGSLRISPGQRVAYAALVALIVFVAPVLLVWLVEPGFDWPGWWVAIGAAIIVPPFVFQLLSRPDPDWGYGLAFAVIPALALAVAVGFLAPHDPEYPGGAGWLIFSVVFAFVAIFLLGMVGASIASLVARPFNPENPLRGPQRLQAWHVGVIVATVDVVAVVAVAAATI
jgi:hypothetical protein